MLFWGERILGNNKKYMDFKIIGVVGQIASGKGILVNYLTEKLFDFFHFPYHQSSTRIKKKGIKKIYPSNASGHG